MEKKGHDFKVIMREKNPMRELLEHYKIPFTSIGSPPSGTHHENLEEYGLMLPRKMLPSDNTITSIIETPKTTWKEKQQRMIGDKVDMVDYMINFFEGLE